jgi:transcriptional regulator with XRE-family HTH domain
MTKLSKRIRDLRYIKGWGPDDLANRAKISRTALYQIESGKTELPRAATLRRIARALGVAPESLLLEAEPIPAGAGHVSPEPSAAGSGAESRPGGPLQGYSLRELELERKFRVLLASPLSDGVARIIEESYRMLPLAPPDLED